MGWPVTTPKAAGETAAMSAPQDQAGDANPDMGSLAKCAKCGDQSSRTVTHHNLLDGAKIECCHSCLDKCWDNEEDSDMPGLVTPPDSIMPELVTPRGEIMREHELVSATGGDPAKMIQLIEGLQESIRELEARINMLELAAIKRSEQELGPPPATAARSVEELWRPPTSSSDNPPQGTAESTTIEGTTTDEWSSVATTPVHQCSGQYCWTCYPPIQGPLAKCKTVGCTRYENRHGASYCAGYCCWFCMMGKTWQGRAWHGKKCQKWNGQFRHDWRNIVVGHQRRPNDVVHPKITRFADHPAP
jgi:hypothetical protein